MLHTQGSWGKFQLCGTKPEDKLPHPHGGRVERGENIETSANRRNLKIKNERG